MSTNTSEMSLILALEKMEAFKTAHISFYFVYRIRCLQKKKSRTKGYLEAIKQTSLEIRLSKCLCKCL